jgi:hypothetical protein
MGCRVLSIAAVSNPRNVLARLNADSGLDCTLDAPPQAVVGSCGVIVEVDVPALPTIVMLDDERAASIGIHVWSVGPVHETHNTRRCGYDRGHLVRHEVLTRMESVSSPCPERICKMVGPIDGEDKVVINVLTHVHGECSSRRQHYERNSDEPSYKNVFQSHTGDIGITERDIRRKTKDKKSRVKN